MAPAVTRQLNRHNAALKGIVSQVVSILAHQHLDSGMFTFPATVFACLDFILVGALALILFRLLFRQRIPKGTVAYFMSFMTVMAVLCRVTTTTGTPTKASRREYLTDAHTPGVGDSRTMG